MPENFPQWASGLAGALRKAEGQWVADTAEGPIRIRFTELNAAGILDHWVYPEAGGEIHIPLRLVPLGAGCELRLTLFRLPGMSDETFAADAQWVMRDLVAAKALLEKQ